MYQKVRGDTSRPPLSPLLPPSFYTVCKSESHGALKKSPFFW